MFWTSKTRTCSPIANTNRWGNFRMSVVQEQGARARLNTSHAKTGAAFRWGFGSVGRTRAGGTFPNGRQVFNGGQISNGGRLPMEIVYHWRGSLKKLPSHGDGLQPWVPWAAAHPPRQSSIPCGWLPRLRPVRPLFIHSFIVACFFFLCDAGANPSILLLRCPLWSSSSSYCARP